MRRWAILLALLVGLATAFGVSRLYLDDPLPGFPRLVLWAWDRPEDLRFLGVQSAGIAYLDRTVFVDSHGVKSKPRTASLQYLPGTPLIAVVRIESSGNGFVPVATVVPHIVQAARSGVRALQVDFDAGRSEREWYRALLIALRAVLPGTLPLTITALESWCDGDSWIRDLPVSDATPMLFQMGAGERIPADFSIRPCRSSVGVAMSELPVRIPYGRRLFFFQRLPWTREAFDAVGAQAGRWQ